MGVSLSNSCCQHYPPCLQVSLHLSCPGSQTAAPPTSLVYAFTPLSATIMRSLILWSCLSSPVHVIRSSLQPLARGTIPVMRVLGLGHWSCQACQPGQCIRATDQEDVSDHDIDQLYENKNELDACLNLSLLSSSIWFKFSMFSTKLQSNPPTDLCHWLSGNWQYQAEQTMEDPSDPHYLSDGMQHNITNSGRQQVTDLHLLQQDMDLSFEFEQKVWYQTRWWKSQLS